MTAVVEHTILARARLLAKLTPLNSEAPNFQMMSPSQMPKLNSGANPDPMGPTWVYPSLTWYQLAHVQRWVAGNFDTDWPGQEPPPIPFDQIAVRDQPDALNEAALEACVGVAFAPGIEGTYDIARLGTYHPERYLRRDLRIDPRHPAGFLTEKMALPWQADLSIAATTGGHHSVPCSSRRRMETARVGIADSLDAGGTDTSTW